MKRRTLTSIALVGFVVVFGFLTIQLWQQRNRTAHLIGVEVEPVKNGLKIVNTMKNEPAARAGIEPGDVIVQIGGVRIRHAADYDKVAPKFKPGEPVSFKVERAGEQIFIPVRPGIPFPWALAILTILTTAAYFALAVVTWFQMEKDPRARLLAAFSLAVALEIAVPIGTYGSIAWWVFGTAWYYVISGIQIGLLLHLASVIPRPAPWLQRHPWIVRLYYGLGILLGGGVAIAVLAAGFGHQLLPWSAEQIDALVFGTGLPVWAFVVITILGFQAHRAQNLTERQHALLVLIGLMPWAVFTLALEILTAWGYSAPGWIDLFQLVVLLPYPAAVFIAIYRLRLFDIELAIKRSLVYTILTVVLIAIFYATLGLGGLFLSKVLGKDPNSMWFISGATLLLGLLFWPIRRALQNFIDRRLFPERLALRQRLVKVAASVPALGSMSAIGRHLVNEVSSAFGLTSATLLIADPTSGVLGTLASNASGARMSLEQSQLLDPEDPGIRLLEKAGRPLKVRHISSVSPSLAARLSALGSTAATGLTAGESLVGLLAIGHKENGELFSAEELDLLNLFSHHAATVLQNVRLFQSATYEGLTGLLRREAILEVLERERQRAARHGRPLAVAMADLDHFKKVNDRHGHLAGDALLKRVAHTLKSNLRSTDAIGRYGGEEFLMVLPETTLPAAIQVAEKLRQQVAELEVVVEGSITIRATVSIGLSVLSPDASDSVPEAVALIDAADRNLLLAKRSGRNRVMPKIQVQDAFSGA